MLHWSIRFDLLLVQKGLEKDFTCRNVRDDKV